MKTFTEEYQRVVGSFRLWPGLLESAVIVQEWGVYLCEMCFPTGRWDSVDSITESE